MTHSILYPLLTKKGESLSESYHKALEAVDEWYELDITVAPNKPTKEMLLAGAEAGKISIEKSYDIYQAMLSAYTQQKQVELLETKNFLEIDKGHKEKVDKGR